MAEERPHVGVFAVEDTAVQLTWRSLPTRHGTLGVGPSSLDVDGGPPAWVHRRHRGSRPLASTAGGPNWPLSAAERPGRSGPGAARLDGLQASTSYDVWWRADGGPRITLGRVATLAPPPGPLLARFATVSDLHVGERHFGLLGAVEERRRPSARLEPYPVRAAEAALAEAAAWGATTILVKGDLTDRARADQFRSVAALLTASPMAPLVQLGNHDRARRADLAAVLPGIPVATADRPLVHDVPGARLVLGDSPRPKERRGHVDARQVALLAEAAAGAVGAAVVSLHHPPARWPLPASYPPGLTWSDSRRLLGALAGANPATLLLAGHSHRNRTYRCGGTLVAEVGSTKDYPGCWAGYAVHEGGIRQVVCRIARPDVLPWTESTATAVGGLWGRWSPGSLADRCWSHTWPSR